MTCRWSTTPGFAGARGRRSRSTCAGRRRVIGATVVKPARLGSSVGMSIVHDLDALPAALDEAFRYDSKVIVEALRANARELECGVLGNDDPIVFEPGEVRSSHEYYDYEAKYVARAGHGRAARRRRSGPGGAPQGAVAGRLPRRRRRRAGAGRLPRHPGRGLHLRDEHAARLHRDQHVSQAGGAGRASPFDELIARLIELAHGARPMKLKPQPKGGRRRAGRTLAREVRATRGRGRGARRPGVPLRQRVGRPSAVDPSRHRRPRGGGRPPAGLVALLGGPWLRVTEVAWAGEQFTPTRDSSGCVDGSAASACSRVDTGALRDAARLPAVAEAAVEREPAGRAGGRDRRARGRPSCGRRARPGCSAPPTARCSRRARARHELRRPWPACRSSTIGAARRASSTVGDRIPAAELRTALRLAELDPARSARGPPARACAWTTSTASCSCRRDPAWELALGVYGTDPAETAAAAAARLERQITAVRTLFATRAETEIGWVDARNPGKVYFRAKG